jgi:hypothetical protein
MMILSYLCMFLITELLFEDIDGFYEKDMEDFI